VVIGAFGGPLAASVGSIGGPLRLPPISEAMLRGLFVEEAVVLVCLVWFLRRRGWSAARAGLGFRFADIPAAFSLWILALGSAWFARMAMMTVFGRHAATHLAPHLVEQGLRLPTIITVAVLAGIYEELFVSGYLVNVLKKRFGLWAAVNISTGLRLACHLYRGGGVVVSVLPLGLIFGYWYGTHNRLWPLILAHIALDVATVSYVGL
jgi:membrane protease YdiL (CAAX protease family)